MSCSPAPSPSAAFVLQIHGETITSRRRWRGVHVLESAASCRLYFRRRSHETTCRPLPASAAALESHRAARAPTTLAILAVPAALDVQRLLQVWAAMSSAGLTPAAATPPSAAAPGSAAEAADAPPPPSWLRELAALELLRAPGAEHVTALLTFGRGRPRHRSAAADAAAAAAAAAAFRAACDGRRFPPTHWRTHDADAVEAAADGGASASAAVSPPASPRDAPVEPAVCKARCARARARADRETIARPRSAR